MSKSSSSSSASLSVVPSEPELRTPEGRALYDSLVLNALVKHGEPARSVDVGPKVGGNPAQLRASLKRLEALGKIEKSGTTRATVYEVKAAE